MRRLNGILEVLSRPGKRADYDRSLPPVDAIRQCPATALDAAAHGEPPDWDGLWCSARWRRPVAAGDTSGAQPSYWEVEKAYVREMARQAGYTMDRRPPHGTGGNGAAWWRAAPWRRSAMLRSVAAVAGVVGLVLFCGLIPPSPPGPKPVTQSDADTDPRLPSAPKTARGLRASLPPAAATQEAAAPTRTLAGSNPAPQERPVEASSPANPEPAEIRAAMLAPADTARESPPGERPSALSGDWVFVPAAGATKSRYAPEFIELRLREREGTMRGSYRARYRVADRAISPTVAFQFEGRAAAEGGVLPWRGAGGSQGAVTLRLLANGHLQVEWEADRLGEELGLISGAATLVRKLE